MLDEPLGALDRSLRDRLVAELRALFVRLGLTILFVTHDHDEAFALADRLVVMHDGRVEQVGTPTDVWQRPASGFVARFLGWNVTSAFTGTPAAVRAGAISVIAGAATNGGIAGVVRARTFRRDHFLLDVQVTEEMLPVEMLQVEVPLDAHTLPDVGETVALTLAPGDAVVLD